MRSEIRLFDRTLKLTFDRFGQLWSKRIKTSELVLYLHCIYKIYTNLLHLSIGMSPMYNLSEFT